MAADHNRGLGAATCEVVATKFGSWAYTAASVDFDVAVIAAPKKKKCQLVIHLACAGAARRGSTSFATCDPILRWLKLAHF